MDQILINSTHIIQKYCTGTGEIIRLPQWQQSNHEIWVSINQLQNLDIPQQMKTAVNFHGSTVGTQIARFIGPTWDLPGSCRLQMGPMLVPWTLLSGYSPYNCTGTTGVSWKPWYFLCLVLTRVFISQKGDSGSICVCFLYLRTNGST